MKQIPLTRGYVTLVDDEDYEELSIFKWYAWSGNGNNHYVKRGARDADGKLKKILMHRQILPAKKEMEIDHINGNGLDNRRANLRLCSHAQNMYNQRIQTKKKTSIYRGVFFDKRSGCWKSNIGHQGQSVHLGSFNREEDAALAYNLAAKKFFGEFARLNDPIALVGANPNRRVRKYTGINNPRAKLDEKMVTEIRMNREASKTLALKFGVCVSTINRARARNTWENEIGEEISASA